MTETRRQGIDTPELPANKDDNAMHLVICLVLTLLVTAPIRAEVVKSTPEGFIVRQGADVNAESKRVFDAMTLEAGQWWHPDHSFSGDAGNMRIDEQCFCERWDTNLVRHMDTTIWLPGSKLVLQGGLGPLKELGLNGTMTWVLTAKPDGGTAVTWTYHVFGYSATDMAALANAVDGVLGQQLGRLVGHLQGSAHQR